MADYSELEEENISLQKQVLQLRQAQVDYEAMKLDNKRLKMDTEDLNAELIEMDKLKGIVEKNLEEALNSLQLEREQRHALKKELDQRITAESLNNLHNMASLGFGQFGKSENHVAGHHDDPEDDPALKHIEADFPSSPSKTLDKPEPAPTAGLVGDLFSEVHMSEIRMLEQRLERTELEKTELQRELEESHAELENLKRELQEKANITNGADSETIKRYVTEITELQEHVKKLETIQMQEASEEAQHEISELRSKIEKYETLIKELRDNLKNSNQAVNDNQSSMNSMTDDLVKVSEDLAQLYHHVCEVNGETPSRVMLDHAKGRSVHRQESPSDSEASEKSFGSDREQKSPEKESPGKKSSSKQNSSEEKGDPLTCAKMLDTVHDQIKYLKRAVHHTMEQARQRLDNDESEIDIEELQEQIVRLKAMLSTKREQIATLRSVLKANKSTAEIALANLKSKYETEKGIVTETMAKLRNELKALKEDAATFSSLRAMFAQRCDEYVTQLDEQQRQLTAAEEEKKTLNSLLRMAIQQKLALTQKIEDLEFDRERRNMRQHRNDRNDRGDRPTSGRNRFSGKVNNRQYNNDYGGYGANRHASYYQHDHRRDY